MSPHILGTAQESLGGLSRLLFKRRKEIEQLSKIMNDLVRSIFVGDRFLCQLLGRNHDHDHSKPRLAGPCHVTLEVVSDVDAMGWFDPGPPRSLEIDRGIRLALAQERG